MVKYTTFSVHNFFSKVGTSEGTTRKFFTCNVKNTYSSFLFSSSFFFFEKKNLIAVSSLAGAKLSRGDSSISSGGAHGVAEKFIRCAASEKAPDDVDLPAALRDRLQPVHLPQAPAERQ